MKFSVDRWGSPRTVTIGERAVGAGHPCFIISEAGSNHDGKLDQARQLIDVAAEAGADAVKFQLFCADRIAARTGHPLASIQYGGARHLHELYGKNELPPSWCAELKEYAEQKGVLFLCSVFDEKGADLLDEIGIVAFKVASFELVHHPLLRHVAQKGKPIVLSTGLAQLGEIEEALDIIRETALVPVVLLHCGINYPLAYESVNLRAMMTMRQAFEVPVGYSDHTLGIAVPSAAVALGASAIEKHFTLSRALSGPDHAFALEPDELKAMVQAIRAVEAAMGSAQKRPAEDERVHISRGRRSLFACVPIPKGTKITAEMLAVLRPGVGLAPKYFDVVVGRQAARDIEANEPITWDAI